MSPSFLSLMILAVGPQISFPQGAVATEQIALRWMHFVAGIIWIGLLYFFNLVGTPTLKGLEPPVRAKIFPALMTRAMLWFRWSALITVVAGLRYFWMILAADAHNAGNPALAWRWMGEWLLVWLVAFALIYPFQLPRTGILDSAWVRAIAIAAIAVAASWIVLVLNANSQSSNGHLAISIGGGMGLLMLLNAWGIIWRAQKRLIAWTRASAEQGTPMPPEAAYFARWAFLASRAGFWMSFPMLFFMAAAEHYPFLSGITN
ncbi:MAG TPA: hypothetical protein VNV41_16775 [Candidatus Acidoferrales bacterium]|jgi:uncharacterized membrane protein|nr:hypothetical protein [Candidatus Acidoferrales bacterium]